MKGNKSKIHSKIVVCKGFSNTELHLAIFTHLFIFSLLFRTLLPVNEVIDQALNIC